MSAFGGKADITIELRNVRFWPKADMGGGPLGRAVSTTRELICDILRLPGVALGIGRGSPGMCTARRGLYFFTSWFFRTARCAFWATRPRYLDIWLANGIDGVWSLGGRCSGFDVWRRVEALSERWGARREGNTSRRGFLFGHCISAWDLIGWCPFPSISFATTVTAPDTPAVIICYLCRAPVLRDRAAILPGCCNTRRACQKRHAFRGETCLSTAMPPTGPRRPERLLRRNQERSWPRPHDGRERNPASQIVSRARQTRYFPTGFQWFGQQSLRRKSVEWNQRYDFSVCMKFGGQTTVATALPARTINKAATRSFLFLGVTSMNQSIGMLSDTGCCVRDCCHHPPLLCAAAGHWKRRFQRLTQQSQRWERLPQ